MLDYIFRIPSSLSWADAQARLLARADGLRPGDAIDARFFVDTPLLARGRIHSPADVHRVVREDVAAAEFPSKSDELGGGWRMRGALDIREIDAGATPATAASLNDLAEHRTAYELTRFLHHIHWIP